VEDVVKAGAIQLLQAVGDVVDDGGDAVRPVERAPMPKTAGPRLRSS